MILADDHEKQTLMGLCRADKIKNIYLAPIILIVALICLLATVTNYVPLSALICVFSVLIPFYLAIGRPISISFVAISMMLFLFFISVIFYYPQSVIEFKFFRRDGNVFITFLPFLLLSLLPLRLSPRSLEMVFVFFILFATFCNLIFMMFYLLGLNERLGLQTEHYFFLFFAHNAAGGMLATLTALVTGFLLCRWKTVSAAKKILWLAVVGINLSGLYLTDSRGSLLGIAAAFGVVLFCPRCLRWLAMSILMIVHVAVVAYGYQFAEDHHLTGNTVTALLSGESVLERQSTIVHRLLFMWPDAIRLFLASPILGVGFGAYNDVPYQIETVFPLFAYNKSPHIVFNDAHAHHTFLHVLAENGLIGCVLLIFVIYALLRDANSLPNPALRLGMTLAIYSALFASLTEHRFFTPSQMLPLTIALGIATAQKQRDALDRA